MILRVSASGGDEKKECATGEENATQNDGAGRGSSRDEVRDFQAIRSGRGGIAAI